MTTRRPDKPRNLESFEGALRGWGRRPPVTSGARATARLRQRLESRRPAAPGLSWRSSAFALACGLLLVVGLALGSRLLDSERLGPGLEAADRTPWEIPTGSVGDGSDLDPQQQAHPTNDGVVLIWLDESTPLYMTFAPPAAGAKRKGTS